MGRWVRWFGAPEQTAVAEPPPPVSGTSRRLMRVSVAEARVVASGEIPASRTATPTGQMSIQQLSAEMLTAVLVQEGVLSTADEHASLQEHRATGRPVEEILVETGKLSEIDMVSVLSRRCKVPHLSLDRYQVAPEVVQLVPSEFARANRLVPLQKLGKVLNVATTNPLDMGTFKRLEEQSGLRIKPVLATPSDLNECLDRYYPPPADEAPPPEPEEDVRITVKDFLKESWLGAVGPADESSTELPAVSPEPAVAPGEAEETAAPAAAPVQDESRAIPLSEDEAAAFTRASSAVLYRDWSRHLGAKSEVAGAAVPVSDIEFAIAAADAPVPKDEPPPAITRASRSGRASRRKKKRRRRTTR